LTARRTDRNLEDLRDKETLQKKPYLYFVIVMKRARIILIWLIGILFIVTGVLKYINMDELSKPVFDRAHYPTWFFYVVGTVELVGGIMLLMTAATSKRLGSILIGMVMLGAMGTHYILKDHYNHFIVPAIIFCLAVLTSLDFDRKSK